MFPKKNEISSNMFKIIRCGSVTNIYNFNLKFVQNIDSKILAILNVSVKLIILGEKCLFKMLMNVLLIKVI